MKKHIQTEMFTNSHLKIIEDVYSSIKNEQEEREQCVLIDLETKRKHDLSFLQAALLGLVKANFDKRKGCCIKQYYFFEYHLSAAKQTIAQGFYTLQKKKLLWLCNFSKAQRHIVLEPNYHTYINYLSKQKKFNLVTDCKGFFQKG